MIASRPGVQYVAKCVVFTITTVFVLASCSDNDHPLGPRSNLSSAMGIVHGTLRVDTCFAYPAGFVSSLDSICGEATKVVVEFDAASGPWRSEFIEDDLQLWMRGTFVDTGPTRWGFSNPHFSMAVSPWLSSGSMRISASRSDYMGIENRYLILKEAVSTGSESFEFSISVDGDFDVDEDGFPVLDSRLEITGRFSLFYTDLDPTDPVWVVVGGRAELAASNYLAVAETPSQAPTPQNH